MLIWILALALSVMQPVKNKPHDLRVKVRPSADAVAVLIGITDGDEEGGGNYERNSTQAVEGGKTIWADFRDIPSGHYFIYAKEALVDGSTRQSTITEWLIP